MVRLGLDLADDLLGSEEGFRGNERERGRVVLTARTGTEIEGFVFSSRAGLRVKERLDESTL